MGASNDADEDAYENALGSLYQNTIIPFIKKSQSAQCYHMIYLQGQLNDLNGYATGTHCFIAPSGQTTEFTSTHELGHTLELNHIGQDLGKCATSTRADGTCEKNVQTNNIMGYDPSRNSLWLWQRRKIKAK